MFIRRRHLRAIEERLYKLEHRCKAIESELKQVICDHAEEKYETNIWAFTEPMDGTKIVTHGKQYTAVCKNCGKSFGGVSRKERARREYEAAKARYNSEQED